MLTLERKLQLYVDKGSKEKPVTLKTLSEVLSVSKQTLYNNKKLVESYGINVIHARAKQAVESELPMLTCTNVDTAPVNKVLYTTVHSFVCEYLVIPCKYTYTDILKDMWLDKRFSVKSAEIYLQRCLDTKGFLPHEERWSTTFLLNDLRYSKTLKFSQEEKGEASTYFNRYTGYTPSEEQVKTLASSIRFIKNSTSSGFGHIQALAGSSKTTLFNVLSQYLVDNSHSFYVVAPTKLAASCLNQGTTLHSFLDKYLSLKSVELSEQHLLHIVERGLAERLFEKVDLLLVDEYTMFSETLLKIIKSLAKCIIFSGDVGQNINNSMYVGPLLGTLTYQYRFQNSSGLQEKITKLRFRNDLDGIKALLKDTNVGNFAGKLVVKEEGNTICKKTDYTGSFDHLKNVLSKYMESNTMIVAYSKAAVTEINTLLNEGTEFKVGSKVSLSKTVYHPTYVSSGSLGKVLSISKDKYKVLFEDLVIEVDKTYLELAYAVTCISSQGSAWNKILFVEGTSNISNAIIDIYVSTTRAQIEFETISRSLVETNIDKVCDALFMEEGNRSSSVYGAINAIIDTAESKGLPRNEALHICSKIAGSKPSLKKEKPKKDVNSTEGQIIDDPNAYSFILQPEDTNKRPVYPYSYQKNKSKAEAQYCLDSMLKNTLNYTGFLTYNLHNQPYIVFDFDKDIKGINKFKHLLETTKGGINVENTSMHLWFKVDQLYETRHITLTKDGNKVCGLDILGNKSETNVNFKPNKKYNDNSPVTLTKELWEELLEHINTTY